MPLEHSPTLPEGGLSDHAPFLKAVGGGGGGGISEAEVLEILAGIKDPGAIKTAGIGAEQITTGLIKALAVTNAVLGEESVTAAKIVLRTITAAQIALEGIKTENIAAEAITSGLIKALAVTTAKLAEESVTVAKLAKAIVERLLPEVGVEGKTLKFAGGKPEWANASFNVAAVYGEQILVTAGVEQEPSATEATQVTAFIFLEKLEVTQFKVEVGERTLYEFVQTPKTANETRQCSFIVPKGKKWKVNLVSGTIKIKVSYLPLGAGS